MTGPTYFLRPSPAEEDAHLIEEAVIGAMTQFSIDAASDPLAGPS